MTEDAYRYIGPALNDAYQENSVLEYRAHWAEERLDALVTAATEAARELEFYIDKHGGNYQRLNALNAAIGKAKGNG